MINTFTIYTTVRIKNIQSAIHLKRHGHMVNFKIII